MTKMMLKICAFISLGLSLYASSQIEHMKEDKAIFLSMQRSGTNLTSCSLLAVTRQPIGLFPNRIHEIGTNRLELPLVSDTPLFYRTHEPVTLENAPSDFKQLILLARNYKELLFRSVNINKFNGINRHAVQSFLDNYLSFFRAFDKWPEEERLVLFYEDLVDDLNGSLLSLLDFLNIAPLFWDDYLENQEHYLQKIYTTYVNQHGRLHGNSSKHGLRKEFYSANKDYKLRKAIDQIMKQKDPYIWETYLKRFETP